MRIKLSRALFWCSLLLVSYLSLKPMAGGAMWFAHQDKVMHASAYLYFYGLGWWAFGQRQRAWSRSVFVGLLVYGIAIEWLQGLSGYRERELLDLAANISGLLLGLWVVVGYCRYQRRTGNRSGGNGNISG